LTFHDHFSRDSASYARYRPGYPAALFEWLAGQTAARRLAWDCATGNGQAAAGLAEHFEHVVATDASADQLREAIAHPRIQYRQSPADRSGLEGSSADLVTCAQALHWLPRDRFFDEVRRVLGPGGVIAVWGYHIPRVGEVSVDDGIRHFHDTVVGPFWPPERQIVLDCFATIEFPFEELTPPPFEMRCDWSLDDFLRYLGTQSATGRYRHARGSDPVPAFAAQIESAWGGRDAVRAVFFPLFMRAGRT
jgi:SAM-dependent methyltransferase